MNEPIQLPTCGACKHFRRDAQRLDMGFCRALPPTPSFVHDPRGVVHQTGHAFPIVQAAQEACGVHFTRRPTIHVA